MKAKMCLLTLIRFSFLNNSFLRNLGIVLTKVLWLALCKGIMQALMVFISCYCFLSVFMLSQAQDCFFIIKDKEGALRRRQAEAPKECLWHKVL